jgi:hypothetical protein
MSSAATTSSLKNADLQPTLHAVTSVAAQQDVVALITDKALVEVLSEEMVLHVVVLVAIVDVVVQSTTSQLAAVVHNKRSKKPARSDFSF